MSSSYTTSAFVVHGGWGTESRKNAALRFVEALAKDFFDARDHTKIEDFYTKDFTCTDPHGEHHTSPSGEHALLPAIQKFYLEPLKTHKHVPYHMIAIETKDGWDCSVQDHLYTNVHGSDASHEKVKDEDGQEWDHKIPALHYFELVKDPSSKIEGLKIKHVTYIKDTGVVNDTLHKRGFGRKSKS